MKSIQRTPVMAVLAIMLLVSVAACDIFRNPTGPEGGNEGPEGPEGAGSEPGESGVQYGLNETFDEVQSGARLILSYDAASSSFIGTAENTTTGILRRVRVEVHLSNGVELGPTTPRGVQPGQVIDIFLSAAGQTFVTWSAHPEVG